MITSLSEFLREALIYIPLSLIGLWRWSFWIIRRLAARLYRPTYTVWPEDKPKPTVSLVTPVYNEDPETFEQAMQSWIKNGVNEIIAVIDKSNTHAIVDYDRRYAGRKDVKCRLVVTPKPGKRAALVDGIERTRGDIIVLVDSDTIWDDNVLAKSLPVFLEPSVGGATVGQRIQNPDTVGNVMFDILLWTRYREEVPFLLGVGKVFNTLSGRTAFYRREALLNPDFDNLHALRHEFFFKTRGVSGDDKRLTHLILEQGWHVSFVLDAWVYTPGLGSLKKFLKQRLRWTRNSWRADLRAVKRGWVWSHPALAVFMIDRFVQPFFMLLGPIACAIAIANREWLAAGILVAWWILSRFVRLFGYFKTYPGRLIYLPAYIAYGYINALMKMYALATLLEHSWATRWHSYRLKTKRVAKRIFTVGSGVSAVVFFIVILVGFVNRIQSESGAVLAVPAPVQTGEIRAAIAATNDSPAFPVLPGASIPPTGAKFYVVQPGDTLSELATRFGTTPQNLKKLNGLKDPDVISSGMTLIYLDTAGGGQ